MSQSGWRMGARNKELKAFTATWVVCEAGSRGQKSSLDRTTAVSVILHAPRIKDAFKEECRQGLMQITFCSQLSMVQLHNAS
jgi:hypothetical protein